MPITRYTLVLQTTVLSLSILTYDYNVHIIMSALYPRHTLAVHHVSKQVQLVSERRERSITAKGHVDPVCGIPSI